MNAPSKSITPLFMAAVDGMRPAHWIKNLFILAAMPFGGKLLSIHAWLMSGGLFLIFCALASAVYLINDVRDREEDRLHVEKRNRAVASGRLPVPLALLVAILLLIPALGSAALLDISIKGDLPYLSLSCVSYLLLNILYTFWIKNVAIWDVIFISMGFVIRVTSGAEAIEVPVSPWLIVCTFMLSLFISIAKRRNEIAFHSAEIARRIRQPNSFYTPERTEHMLSVAASLAIMSYSLYCISPQTRERIGSEQLIWTIPFVVYGIFRYYCLSGVPGFGDPVKILLKDRGMWIIVAIWLIAVLLIMHGLP